MPVNQIPGFWYNTANGTDEEHKAFYTDRYFEEPK